MTDSSFAWLESAEPNCRDFRICRNEGRDVTGAVWLPEDGSSTMPLMLFGHGASGDRYQMPIASMAQWFLDAGAASISIDGPVHGLRQIGEGGRVAFVEEVRRTRFVDDMIDDWNLAVDSVLGEAELKPSRVGYFGLSMGSMFGIPLIAARRGIDVACLGLLGSGGAARVIADRLREDADSVTQPVLFLMQLQDELFDRMSCLELFDCFASDDKRLHANPGLHPEVPKEEMQFAFQFLRTRLEGDIEREVMNPLAE